jgi:hypothetical protein
MGGQKRRIRRRLRRKRIRLPDHPLALRPGLSGGDGTLAGHELRLLLSSGAEERQEASPSSTTSCDRCQEQALVKGAAHVAASGRLQEQGVEHLALGVVERSEHLVLNRRECALGLCESLRAGFGERDDVAAAILG